MAGIAGVDYESRWERSHIPVRFRGQGLDKYEPSHHSGRIALKEARKFIENFGDYYVSPERRSKGDYPEDRRNIGRGLMLWGKNGTRKTTLAAAIATEVQWLSLNHRVYMTRFSDFKDALTTTFEKEDSERKLAAREVVLRAQKSTLVVLDDIGQEHRTTSGFTESLLHELIRKRVEAGLPTVVTTNIEPEDMLGTYGQSFDSFRKEAFEPIMMIGPDSRKSYED
ncbi:DnaC-like helicase loader [Streptomyces phage BRock]|uniref:DNA replication protein n=1 Tax=Streptomyces phage BRock TaxID=1913591 RepID=A0A1J0GW16_9CAUD|nr:DnaC-like helicase loader [Streptomyces phage BRock]APC46375.1 DNA replication protein [Streptomyces phage BRock]